MLNLAERLPAPVRGTALSLGAPGAAWLAGLDRQMAGLCERWQLTFVEPLSGGTEAYVAAVVAADGGPAVLKIAPPGGRAFAGELATLLLAGGRGYAAVHAHDAAERAVLMERLGPQLAELGWSLDAQLRAICATLKEAWQAAPASPDLMTGAEKAAWLGREIAALWEELGRPCAERTVETALDHAEARQRAHDAETAVLAHGDAHAWNTLALPGGDGFKLVDPDGLAAERAYDLAIPMREWSEDLLAGDPLRLGWARCRRLAALAGVDPQAIWAWGFVERVSTGLLCLKGGMGEGRLMLAVADAWAR